MKATDRSEALRRLLARGPATAQQLIEKLGVSQPTLSRGLTALGSDVVRHRVERSIHYLLCDQARGLPSIPVYRVTAEGQIAHLGLLSPVAPEGFLMQEDGGKTLHSEGLPWWLLDMRPQGFVGRAYAARHAQALGLPPNLAEWSDTQALRALLVHGHDAVGNLLLGDVARDAFLNAANPQALPAAELAQRYAQLAAEALQGGAPGSSAGGEQPKFSAYAETSDGPRHVLVKFTLPEDNPVTARWRDLLLAEHHALRTLSAAGVPAAPSRVIDHAGQRFLETQRFDRVGALGRRGLLSLAAVEAEFVGGAGAAWPELTQRLATPAASGKDAVITPEAHAGATLLHAFGTLIGNIDMHAGNLSFLSDSGRPYTLAPAYDMLPMAFAPRATGNLPDTPPPVHLRGIVPAATWRQALALSADYLGRLRGEAGFTPGFGRCVEGLEEVWREVEGRVGRMG